MSHKNEPDHPLVRASSHCVACGQGDKPVGLLLHWSCHRDQTAKYDGGYSQSVERALDALEATLGKVTRWTA